MSDSRDGSGDKEGILERDGRSGSGCGGGTGGGCGGEKRVVDGSENGDEDEDWDGDGDGR